MHQDDGAVAQMGMLHYFGDNGVCAVVLPVQTVHIPLYHMISQAVCGLYERIVIVAVGRAEQHHIFPGQFLYLFVYFLNLFLAVFRAEL